jgi:Ni/Co efflux regulator RcnB
MQSAFNKQSTFNKKVALAVFVAGVFMLNPAFAEKPEFKHKGKPEKVQEIHNVKPRIKDQNIRTNDLIKPRTSSGTQINVYFDNHHRDVIRRYYDDSYHSGRCPPGLSKKHNRCQPPGLAKKWHVGRRLPRDVIYYDLPPQIVISLGIPPEGQKYVRVATDILLITVGTGLVLDAIQDLNNL